QRARAPAGVEELEVNFLVAAVGEAAGIAVADGERADSGNAAIEHAGAIGVVIEAERRLEVTLAPGRIPGDLTAAQIEPAEAEVGVLGQQTADAGFHPEGERQPALLEHVDRARGAWRREHENHGESAQRPVPNALHYR